MDNKTKRAEIKEFLLKTFGTLTLAAHLARMGEANLNMILSGRSSLPLGRLSESANGWGVDLSYLIPLLSEENQLKFESLRETIVKETLESSAKT